jgi:sec-independent protein translocase protein TatA
MPLHGWEFLIIVVVILIVFGVGKLPQTLGSLGKGVRSFRKAAAGEEDDEDDNKELLKSKSKKEESVKEKDSAGEEKN